MPTTTDVINPVFDAMRVGQEAWVGTLRSWLEFGQRFWPTFVPTSWGEDERPLWPTELVDNSFDAARRMLGIQEDCARALLEATEPIFGLKKAEERKAERPTKAGSAEKSSS